MKKRCLMVILLLLIFTLSMGAINAEDSNQTDAVGVDDSNPKSFSELNEDIYNHMVNGTAELDLGSDYEFVEESDEDYARGISIDGNVTINGHDHVIDCKNVAIAFSLNRSYLCINDLTIRNGNPNMMLINTSKCVLNNVKFIDDDCDNSSNKELIIIFDQSIGFDSNESYSELNITKCCFYSKTTHITDLSSFSSVVNIRDSVFDGGNVTGWGHIKADSETQLNVDNTTFTNLTGKYATAIFASTYSLSVRNSRFANLYANMTAGAIGIKFSNYFSKNLTYVIENCVFENTCSVNEGGAIFFDVGGATGDGIYYYNTTLNIINSHFSNCISSFGGAIVQLGGFLNVVNSTFNDNFAFSCGGAIYTSVLNASIADSTFTNNTALYRGGALFHDNYILNVEDSIFKDNKVAYYTDDSANAIYAYDSDLNIENSYFKNGGVSIYADFCEFTENNNTYDGDLLSTDNSNYEYFMGLHANPIKLINNTFDVADLPSRFDLRDWGWISPVENQGHMGSCWAFGAIAAIESALRKSAGLNYTLSVNNMQNMELIYSRYGSEYLFEGGFSSTGMAYVLSWLGTQWKYADLYDELGKLSDIVFDSNETVHVPDVIVIQGQTNQSVQNIKEALMKYGALLVNYCSSMGSEPNYNGETFAFYGDPTSDDGELRMPNHSVAIVGWDDNFSRDNFIITPEGDGAWIVKNSWGTEWGDGGYFYMSYFEPSLLLGEIAPGFADGAVAYSFENNISYHINYQTDFAGLDAINGNYTYYSNEYESIFNELIGAVGTYFNETGIEYELKVYVNDELKHTQSGVSDFQGFKTIILDRYVPVKVNDTIRVEFKSNCVAFAMPSRLPWGDGVSMVSDDGKNWIDSKLLESTVCLKVYTVIDDSLIVGNENVTADYADAFCFAVRVITADGHTVGSGVGVNFTINGKTTQRFTDSEGIAKIKIKEVPGKYTITTTYRGVSLNNALVVKQVLKASKVKIKKSSGKFALKAKLKISGKAVKGKKITFKFNGKKYAAKTNRKGVAKVTVKKDVIKKLKKGKTYKVKVVYLKDAIKTTVKVK